MSERREFAPYGTAGGGPGAKRMNMLIHGGKPEKLPGRAAMDVRAGDILRIETSGGGGYGPNSA